ncbi:thiamine-phosphate kinase [Nitrospira sp. Kam-Ns4a]
MPTPAARGAPLHEFGLIRDLARRFGQTGPSVLQGIGDDAAAIRPVPGRALLLTTDLLAEGVHFNPATATWDEIGYKAAVANLSDIAAMGGVPRYLLVALALPTSRTAAEIRRLYRGMMRACRAYGVELIGGDTSASRSGLFLSLTLAGIASETGILRRSGARVGDLIYVTGTLGDALAGLELLGESPARALRALPPRYRRYLLERHRRPSPRLKEGRLLAAHRLATAAIDLSDGLSGDLAHICEQSSVGALIEAAALPLSPACRAYAQARGLTPAALALRGGEDYELLFTVPPRRRARLERLARRHGCRFTCIGTVRLPGEGLRLRGEDGTVRRLIPTSYEHFHRPAPGTR